MSADNMIYIQKRGDRWWVWMGFASDSRSVPSKRDESFATQNEATAYAFDWYGKESVVEYGVIKLPDMKPRKNRKATT